MAIIISDEDFEQIRLAVGSILTDREDGKDLLYTPDDIKKVAILPALDTYFQYFPIQTNYEVAIGGGSGLTIPFPDVNTYGVTNVSVVNRSAGNTSSTSNFWNDWAFTQLGYGATGKGLSGGYGTGANINGSRHLRHLQRAQIDSLSNEGTYTYNVNDEDRTVYVYSSFSGNVFLNWAKRSNDFNKINFARKKEVIKLAKGFLLKETGMVLSIIPDTGAAIDIDAGVLKETGDEYISEIMEKWELAPKIALLRS